MFIYLITNRINGKTYVGQTSYPILHRWYGHISETARGSKLPLHNAIRKHGKQNFTIEELYRCENNLDLDLMEQFFIAVYQSMDKDKGYNLLEGGSGGGRRGFRTTEETRRKQSEAAKGRRLTPEWVANSATGRRGGKRSAESRQKMSQAKTGRQEISRKCREIAAARVGQPLSDEAKAKLSEKNAGENNPFYGKTHTEEARRRMSEKGRGRKHTAEARKNMSDSRRGKPFTEERKQAIAEAQRARWARRKAALAAA